MNPGVVLKVGGSLYSRPDFVPSLQALVRTLPRPVLVVPGGGAVADAVRELDRIHHINNNIAHQIAIASLHTTATWLRTILTDATIINVPYFVDLYETLNGPIPAGWHVTTDSLAAYVAAHVQRPLLLVKSVRIPPGTPWPEAATAGWVDAHFPNVVAKFQLEVHATQLPDMS